MREPMYQLTACPVGTMPVPGWECFFARNDTALYDLTFYVWLVRGDHTLGLVDAGLPPGEDDMAMLDKANQQVDERCVYRDVSTLDEVLERQGVRPEAIDFVAITQPITYHTGSLLPQFFPRAEVYISRAGVFELLLEKVNHPPRQFYFTRDSWQFIYDLLLEDRLRLVDDPTEIAPGVWFETTGGHHPGSAAVRVPTDAGVVGLLETAFLQRNVDDELPIGVAESVAECRRAIRRYKGICDTVVAIHEPENAGRFV